MAEETQNAQGDEERGVMRVALIALCIILMLLSCWCAMFAHGLPMEIIWIR